jgi:hypothetical protein
MNFLLLVLFAANQQAYIPPQQGPFTPIYRSLGKTRNEYECQAMAWSKIPWRMTELPNRETHYPPLNHLPYYRYDANGACFFIWYKGAPLG